MPRLIYLEPTFDLAEFTIGQSFDIAYLWVYTDDSSAPRADKLCITAAFGTEDLDMTGELVMRFQECSKTLYNCIYNFKNWTGDDAKIIDECSQSSKTTITVI